MLLGAVHLNIEVPGLLYMFKQKRVVQILSLKSVSQNKVLHLMVHF